MCPNTASPEWVALSTGLNSSADAHTAWVLNSNSIPTLEEAQKLLGNLKKLERDEQLSRSSDAFKLQRAVEQRISLETMKYRGNVAQQAALDKLIAMNDKYQDFLKENVRLVESGQEPIKTISVSNFIGSADFKQKDKNTVNVFEDYKFFGTFMHEVLELAQVEALRSDSNIGAIMTREFFDKTLKNYVAKTPFAIDLLTDDHMFDMAIDLVKNVDHFNFKNFLILPEVTVVGTSSTNSKVVGRLDLMLVDSQGRIKIFDFKTKKVTGLVQFDATKNKNVLNVDNALVNLAEQQFTIDKKVGTDDAMLDLGARTAYDTWMMQLDIYANMLEQNGLETTDRSIFTLMYQIDENKQFQGATVHVFDQQDYYEQAVNTGIDYKGFWFREPNAVAARIKAVKKIVDKTLPTQRIIEAESKKKTPEETYDFIPSENNDKKIVEMLTRVIDGQLSELYQKLDDLEKNDSTNEGLKKILEKRRDTLKNFKNIIEANKTKSATDLLRSANFFNVVDTIETDLKEMRDISTTAIESFRTKGKIKQSKAEVTQILTAFRNVSNFTAIVKALQNIVNEAEQNPDNRLTQESPVKKKLSLLYSYTESVEANFREIALENSIQVLKTPGRKVFEAVNKQVKDALLAERYYLVEKNEKLKDGSGSSLLSNMKTSLFSFASKEFKRQVDEQLAQGKSQSVIDIQNNERRILQIDQIINGYSYDDQALKDYITSVSDPESILYIGAQNVFNTSAWTQGWSLDQAIASATNSELGIAAPTMLLKNAEAQARQNVFTDEKLLKLDRLRNKLMKQGYTPEQLNKIISSYREVSFYNSDTKQMDKKRVLFLTKPYSEAYENTFKEFSIKIKLLNKEVSESKALYFDNFNTPEAAQYEKEYQDKISERNALKDEHIKWLTENATLPYTDDFYNLQSAIPTEIRDEMQKIYMEKEVLMHTVGKGNEIQLTDDDYDRLQELEVELKALKEKAKELNPAYEEYLEKFNELYEFDTDEKYYQNAESNAKARFADSPELLEKWYKENTVDRPTADWYEELADLYEQRAELFGSNPEIMEIIDQRNKIKRKYKIGGRFNPKYVTDEDMAALDHLDSRMDQIMELLEESPNTLTKEERQAAKELSQAINKLVSTQINPLYTKEFDESLKELYGFQARMNDAQAKVADARTTGDKKAEKEAFDELTFHTTQFGEKEQEFEKWYNKFHYNKYKSILSGYDVRGLANPKSVNKQRMPSAIVRDQYMETVPNPKYFSIKTLRKESWRINGEILSSKDIAALKENPAGVEALVASGQLTIGTGAYNPNFIKTADGVPMPRGVVDNGNGEYVIQPGYEGSANIDESYKNITSNADLFEFYNALTDSFFSLQKGLEGRKIGYQVPGFTASTVETYNEEGSLGKTFDKQWKTFVDKHARISEQDVTDNSFGELGDRIRMRFTNQLPENLQSKDAIGSVMKYAVEAHANIAMQDVAPMVDTFIEHLRLMRSDIEQQTLAGPQFITDANGVKRSIDMNVRLKELDTVIAHAEYERRKFMYGQADLTTNKMVKKKLNALFGYTSFIRIGFDVSNQVKNSISGNVQSFLAAGGAGDSTHYKRKDWMWAKGKLYGKDGFLHNYFADWGKLSDVSESSQLYRYMNPTQKDHMKYFEELTGGRKRKIASKLTSVQELGYLLQDKGDTEIGVTVMYAVMNSYTFPVIDSKDPITGDTTYKRDATGEILRVPAHEAYYLNGSGVLVRRPDVEYSEKDEAQMRNIIYSEMRRAQGNYAKADQTKAEESIMGKMVFFFRKFLVPQFLNRFGYLRPSWEGSDAALGYWRAVIKANKYFGTQATLKEFILGRRLAGKIGGQSLNVVPIKDPATGKVTGYEDIGDFYSVKVAHARKDAIAMAALTILSLMALSYVKQKDDDDEELGMLEGNAFRVLWGVKGETTSMFPLGGGSQEYIKNFTTAIPFVREATALTKSIDHGTKLGMAMIMNGGEEPDPGFTSDYYEEVYKDAFYMRDSGAYEKGDPKIMKDFMDMTGLKNFRDLANPSNRIDQLKGKM
jgi:hypothetical protein